MTLKEYSLDGKTFLFDDGDVPKGAKLVGDIKESVSPGTFEDLVLNAKQTSLRKAARKPANKQAPEPDNKD